MSKTDNNPGVRQNFGIKIPLSKIFPAIHTISSYSNKPQPCCQDHVIYEPRLDQKQKQKTKKKQANKKIKRPPVKIIKVFMHFFC